MNMLRLRFKKPLLRLTCVAILFLTMVFLSIQTAQAAEMVVYRDGIPTGFVRNPDYAPSTGCGQTYNIHHANMGFMGSCDSYMYFTGAEMNGKAVFAKGYNCENGGGMFYYAVYGQNCATEYVRDFRIW